MSSMVWNFFTKPQQVTDTLPCPKCQTVLTFKGTTSGLMKHLRNKHPLEYERCLNVQNLPDQYFYRPNPVCPEKNLVDSFCTGRIPFSFAQNPEFVRFCKSLNPNFQVPTATRIRESVESLRENHVERVRRAIENSKEFAINTDVFSTTVAPFFSAHVSFVNPTTFERQTLLLNVKNCQEDEEEALLDVLNGYQIKVKNCTTTICDSEAVEIIDGLRNLPCAGYAIFQIFEEFFDSFPSVKDLHATLMYNCDTMLDADTKNEVMSRKTSKWTKIYSLFHFLVTEHYFIYFGDETTNPAQFHETQEILRILGPLNRALEELTKENSHISDIVPNLLSVKEEIEENSEMEKRLVELIHEKIRSYLSFDQILIAMLCDPRYAYIPDFIDPHTWKDPEQLILKHEPVKTNIPSRASSVMDSPRVPGVAGLLKRKLNNEDVTKSLASELLHYQAIIASHRPDHTSDPLQFWKEQQYNLPKMTKIAVRALTSMATTSPAEKLYTKLISQTNTKNIDTELYMMGHVLVTEEQKRSTPFFKPDTTYQQVPLEDQYVYGTIPDGYDQSGPDPMLDGLVDVKKECPDYHNGF